MLTNVYRNMIQKKGINNPCPIQDDVQSIWEKASRAEGVLQIEIDFPEEEVKCFKEILEHLHALFERHGITIIP